MVTVVDALRNSVQKDLVEAYQNIVAKGLFKDLEFYEFIFSSNPKPYPISGLQHFLGTGFVAARLASFLGLDDYHIIVAFLSGVFHDLHKISVKLESEKDSIYEKMRKTNLYDIGIRPILGEKKAESAFKDSLDLSLKLWSGGVPRNLQCLAEIVAVADILTGSEESWELSYDMNTLVGERFNRNRLCNSSIMEENLFPVYIGKQRPLVAITSEQIEEELEKLNAVPLISTPGGMLFLAKDPINALSVYEKISDSIMSSVVDKEDEMEQKKEKEIDVSSIKDFLDRRDGRKKSLAPFSRTYMSIAGYSIRTIEKTFERVRLVPEDLRLFVLVLAYIYSKDPNKKENNVIRIRKYLDSLGISSIEGNTVGEILLNFNGYLRGLEDSNNHNLIKLAESAKNFVLGEMKKFRTIDKSLLVNKMETYVSLRGTKSWKSERLSEKRSKKNGNSKRCAVCREPTIIGRSLSSYLQELKKDAIKGINVSELFHPDIKGRPEKNGSIEETGRLTVCETCYFEAMSYRQFGHTDGLWASVLVYYPSMSIDLMKAIKGGIEEATGHRVRVLNDYMTSRIIIPTRSNVLTRDHLKDAIAIWYIFGGNLVVTTVALGSAFAWGGLPVELEVSDAIVEEAVSKYMEILKRIRKYAWFTEKIRYWLYLLLSVYFDRLEERVGRSTSLRFSRSMTSATGYPTIDVFSILLKQS